MYYKQLFLVILVWVLPSQLSAQLQCLVYTDIGHSTISEGLFVKTAGTGTYRFYRNKIEAGYQLDLKGPGSKIFTGTRLKLTREASIGEHDFELQGLFLYNPFSELVHESNWGLSVEIPQKHFKYQLGIHFRNYRITKKAMNTYDIRENLNVQENWNLIYRFSYNIKPEGHYWNIGISLTNMDYFIINQETNPWINLHVNYKPSRTLTLFAQTCYKRAGIFNISSNYFSFFVRTGLICQLGLLK